MIKKLLFTLIVFTVAMVGKAQVVAYPSVNDFRTVFSYCTDLQYTNPVVIGHQMNVEVNYYLTLEDAQNENNSLERFYVQISNPQTIYSRVNSTLNSDFAIADCVIDSAEFNGAPPAGIGPCDFDACDSDNDGSVLVYLDKLRCKYDGYAFPTTTFCASANSGVTTTYYLTESDAMSETNPINPIYTLTGTQNFYRKLKNTTTEESLIEDLITVHLVTCTEDTDGDGIMDLAEDANRNLLNNDDDTDMDGLKNFEDDDDDGDGILTINEDYNNNGDPTDDDTNFNGVADYLESNVTLDIIELLENFIKIYPNPTDGYLNIVSNTPMATIEIYNYLGQLVFSIKEASKIDVSSLSEGVYVMILKDFYGNSFSKKIIKR